MDNVITSRDRNEMLDTVNVKGKVCAEIEVFTGEFSREILSKNPRELYLVDPWVHQPLDVYPADHTNVDNFEFEKVYREVCDRFRNDSRVHIIREYSYFASTRFEDGHFDFIYIDSIHTFESCFCDIVTWFHKLKDEGWLCGHDYTGRYLGVKHAVGAFTRLTGQQLSLLTLEEWASWGIKKSSASFLGSAGRKP
jgi:hypothetical protein